MFFLAAGRKLISASSLVFYRDKSLTDKRRPIAEQIETPRRIQLTDNWKKAQ